MQIEERKVPRELLKAIGSMLAPYQGALGGSGDADRERGRRFLRMDKAVRMTGLSRWTLRRAVDSGELRCSKLSPARTGRLVFEEADLVAWLEGKKIGSVNQNKETQNEGVK